MKKLENKNTFDESIQDVFVDFKMEAPKSVWIKIEKELDKREGKKIIPIFSFRNLSIAASFILLFGLGSIFYIQIKDKEYYNSTKKTNDKGQRTIINPVKDKNNVNRNDNILSVLKVPITNSKEVIISANTKIKKIKNSVNSQEFSVQKNHFEKISESESILPENIEIALNPPTELILDKINDEKTLDNTSQIKKNNSVLATNATISSSANKSNKKEIINVVDVINFVAEKISSSDKKVLEVQKRNLQNETLAMNYKIDLGFVKFSRITN